MPTTRTTETTRTTGRAPPASRRRQRRAAVADDRPLYATSPSSAERWRRPSPVMEALASASGTKLLSDGRPSLFLYARGGGREEEGRRDGGGDDDKNENESGRRRRKEEIRRPGPTTARLLLRSVPAPRHPGQSEGPPPRRSDDRPLLLPPALRAQADGEGTAEGDSPSEASG